MKKRTMSSGDFHRWIRRCCQPVCNGGGSCNNFSSKGGPAASGAIAGDVEVLPGATVTTAAFNRCPSSAVSPQLYANHDMVKVQKVYVQSASGNQPEEMKDLSKANQ